MSGEKSDPIDKGKCANLKSPYYPNKIVDTATSCAFHTNYDDFKNNISFSPQEYVYKLSIEKVLENKNYSEKLNAILKIFSLMNIQFIEDVITDELKPFIEEI